MLDTELCKWVGRLRTSSSFLRLQRYAQSSLSVKSAYIVRDFVLAAFRIAEERCGAGGDAEDC